MAGGDGFRNLFTLLGPAPIAAHLGVEPGFVHKHPLPRFNLAYFLLVGLAELLDPWRVLLLGVDRLFLRRNPIFLSVVQIENWLLCRRSCCSSFFCNSFSVRSGWLFSQARSCSRIGGVNFGLRPGRCRTRSILPVRRYCERSFSTYLLLTPNRTAVWARVPSCRS